MSRNQSHEFVEMMRDFVKEIVLEELDAAAPGAKTKKKAKTKKSTRRARRTAKDLERQQKEILRLLRKAGKDGLRSEDLRDLMGIPATALRLPLDRLIEDGAAKYSGNTRATTYYAAK